MTKYPTINCGHCGSRLIYSKLDEMYFCECCDCQYDRDFVIDVLYPDIPTFVVQDKVLVDRESIDLLEKLIDKAIAILTKDKEASTNAL